MTPCKTRLNPATDLLARNAMDVTLKRCVANKAVVFPDGNCGRRENGALSHASPLRRLVLKELYALLGHGVCTHLHVNLVQRLVVRAHVQQPRLSIQNGRAFYNISGSVKPRNRSISSMDNVHAVVIAT